MNKLSVKMGIFGSCPIALLQDKAVTPNAVKVFIALASFEGTNAESFPSREKIAERAGLSAPEKVSRAIRILADAGWVTVIQRGKKQTNIYRCMLKSDMSESGTSQASDMSESGMGDMPESGISIVKDHLKEHLLEPRGSRPAEPPVPVSEDCDEKALHRRLREHFESTYPVYHPNKAILYWDAKCGSCTKKIITAARLTANITGEDIDRVIGDKLNLFAANFKNPDKFYSDQTYTPALLLSQWNRLTPKTESKTISLSDFMKMTPEEQEKARRENRAV